MPPKGISPLIATILLIAFVIAVGGVLSGWLISFSRESTEEARVRGETDIKCSYAGLYISDATCNSTDPGKLTLITENTGSEDLTDFSITVIYDNNTAFTLQVTPGSTTLSPGDVQAFYNNTDIGDCNDIAEVIIKSNTCPVDSRDKILDSDMSIVS
ncbi:MAG: hypothetical protein JSV92_05250 [archaeon]|nr:MAG: hypothetical protein JSV92_05250 [archaeon]